MGGAWKKGATGGRQAERLLAGPPKLRRLNVFDGFVTEPSAKTNKFCDRSSLSNEATVEQFFVSRLLKDLGYKDSEIKPKKSIDELVVAHGSKKSNYKPDYVTVVKKRPRWLIDAKAVNQDIDDWTWQCAGYALGLNKAYSGEKPLRFFMLTNGVSTKVFKWDEDEPVLSLDFGDFTDGNPKFIVLRDMLAADTVRKGWPAKPKPQQTTVMKKPTPEEVKRLFAQCHNRIHRSEKMSPQAAFYEFVKIMFIKLKEDDRLRRDPEIGPALKNGQPIPRNVVKFSVEWIESLEGTSDNPVEELLFKRLMEQLEERVSKGEMKRIFEPNVKINLQPDTIKDIVRRLEPFDLFGVDEDLNGRLFEHFLSATMRGKGLGQFFTPRSVVKLMTRIAAAQASRDGVEKVLDACCGTGGFLIEVLTDMRNQVRENTSLSPREAEKLGGVIAHESIFGIDDGKDPPIARIARINMYLHGDGGSRIYKVDALDKKLPEDAVGSAEQKHEVKELRTLLIDEGLLFDVVLTNPPFSMDYTDRIPREHEILAEYELTKYGWQHTGKGRSSLRTSILFTERYYDFLRPGGRLVTVIDDSILAGSKYKFIRDYIREKFIIRAVISLPGDAFQRAGARAKTSVLFLVKRASGESGQPSLFMKETKWVGLDDVPQRTPASKATAMRLAAQEEIKAVAEDFQKFLSGKKGPWLVPSSRITERLDVKACLPRKVDVKDEWEAKHIQVVHLGEIVDHVFDAMSPKDDPDHPFGLLRIDYDGIAKMSETRLGKELSYSEVMLAVPGDIVISNISAVYGSVGVIDDATEGLVMSREFIVLRPKNGMIEPLYLWGYLRSPEVRARLLSRASGMGRHRVDWDFLKGLPVPMLPMEERSRIAKDYNEALKKSKESSDAWKAAEQRLTAELHLDNEWAIDRLKAAKPPR